MRKFPFLLISLFALFIPRKSAFCQTPDSTNVLTNIYSGYVVYQTGDTVKCEFRKPTFGVLKYRPANTTGKFKKPTLDAVKEYHSSYDSTVYIAVSMATDTAATDMDMQYLARLENGIIKLYEQAEEKPPIYMNGVWTGGYTLVYYFINKNDGLLKSIKSNYLISGSRKNRREYLYELFSDDPALAEKFKNEQKFDLRTIRRYVKTYNTDKSSTGNN